MKIILSLIIVLLFALWPVAIRDDAVPERLEVKASLPAEPRALAEFKHRLLEAGRDLGQHGVYIETLDGAQPLAAFNSDAHLNPPSVPNLHPSPPLLAHTAP